MMPDIRQPEHCMHLCAAGCSSYMHAEEPLRLLAKPSTAQSELEVQPD